MFLRLDQEKLTNDKHSSLLRKSVIYGQKKFYNIGPCAEFLTLHVSMLVCFMQITFIRKLLHLELKTQFKQLLGYIPLALTLSDKNITYFYGTASWLQQIIIGYPFRSNFNTVQNTP